VSNKLVGSILPLIGRVATPAAMVVFLAHEISSSQAVNGGWQTAVILGAIATAVGIEIVGILSGHALEGFWRVGDKGRAGVAFILLIVYTAAGIVILRHNPTLLPIPIIAAVLYIVAALVDGLETAVSRQSSHDTAQDTFEREQNAKDRDLARQLKKEEQAAKTAVSLARIEAKSAPPQRHDTRQDVGEIPADWRQVTRKQRRELAHLSREERELIMPKIAPRTRRDWHDRLDNIAKQNGGYKA
jgi:hypothetical protein